MALKPTDHSFSPLGASSSPLPPSIKQRVDPLSLSPTPCSPPLFLPCWRRRQNRALLAPELTVVVVVDRSRSTPIANAAPLPCSASLVECPHASPSAAVVHASKVEDNPKQFEFIFEIMFELIYEFCELLL
jgi:hypothetical protein